METIPQTNTQNDSTTINGNPNVEKDSEKAEVMTGDLDLRVKAEAEKIKKLLNDANTNDLTLKYRAACLIAAVMKEGATAVDKLNGELGYGKSWLYQCASVVERWPEEEEIAKLIERNKTARRPVSFSHLVEVARIENKPDRELMLDEILKQGLSVAAVKNTVIQVNDLEPTSTGRAEAGRAATIRRAASMAERLQNEIQVLESALGDLAKSKVKAGKAIDLALDDAEKQYEATQEAAKRALQAIRKAKAELAKQKAGKKVTKNAAKKLADDTGVVKDSTRKVEPGASAAQR